MKKFLFGFLAAITLIGIAYGGYYYGTKSKIQEKNQTSIYENPLIVPTTTSIKKEVIKYVNPSVTIEAITENFNNKTYSGLEPYMAKSIKAALYASEAPLEPYDPKQTSVQLDYFNKAISPWDFSDTNPIALKLSQAIPELFKEKIIGTSSDGYAVVITLDGEFLISEIILIRDYKLIVD